MIDYKKRLVEVDEILSHMSYEELTKIPEYIRKIIRETKDKNYNWVLDESKSISEQNINRDTVIILSYLNTEYILSNEQRMVIQKIHELNEINNGNNINNFNLELLDKTNTNNFLEDFEKDNFLMLQSQKTSFLKRCIDKIKLIFKL